MEEKAQRLGQQFAGAMQETVRVRVSEVGKKKTIQWGEELRVFAQSIKPVGRDNKVFRILERQDLR